MTRWKRQTIQILNIGSIWIFHDFAFFSHGCAQNIIVTFVCLYFLHNLEHCNFSFSSNYNVQFWAFFERFVIPESNMRTTRNRYAVWASLFYNLYQFKRRLIRKSRRCNPDNVWSVSYTHLTL